MSAQTIPHALGVSTPDFAEAARFLSILDPDAEFFTFQTFDDLKPPRPGRILKIDDSSAPLKSLQLELARLNAKGAGIFVTVNETGGNGRKAKNIIRVRAVWFEFDKKDGKPLPEYWPLDPSMIVESSPGNFHFYWLLSDGETMTPDQHGGVMRRMVEMGSDPVAADLSRVLRVPGFFHMKDSTNPHRVELREVSSNLYTVDEILAAFPPVEKAQVKPVQTDASDFLNHKPDHLKHAPALEIGNGRVPVSADELSAMLAPIPSDDRDTWRTVGMALNDWDADAGKPIWDTWSATSTKYNAAEQDNQWGQFRPGKGVTVATIIKLARDAGYTAPAAFARTEPNAPGDCLRDHHSLTLAQLLALPPPPPAIHDGYYRLGEVTVVIGASSVGKTTMLMRDAFEIVQSGLTVVTISAEDEAPNYARKLAALAILDGFTDDATLQRVHCFTSALRQLILPNKTGADPNVSEFQRLTAALQPYAPSVVILETASSLGTGEETNGQLAALAKGLIWLARDLNAAVVISHHTNKQAALNADTSQHAARGGSSFTANTRETINIVKPTSEEMPGVMAQYRLPARYSQKYALDEQAFKDGRVILAHHAKCANGPETPPRGYLRVSISHGVERSFAPVSGALIRLERLDDGTAAHNRIVAGRQADGEKRAKMQAAIRAWIQDSRAAEQPTYAYSPRGWPVGDPRLCGFSARAIVAEIEVLLLEGKLKKRPAPKPKQPKLEELCLPEEAEK